MATVIEPKVNGRRMKEFGVEMVSYTVGPCETDDTYTLPPSRIIPIALSARVKLRTIKITLDFSGNSDHDITLMISKFTSELFGEVHLELPDGFLYWCAYVGASTPEVKAPWIQQVTFTFAGFRHLRMKSFKLFTTAPVFIEGNVETPLVVKVTPGEGTDVVTFNGITVSNMTGPVTIDGVYTTILDVAGSNKFGDTDMTEWPKLTPGKSEISVSGAAEFEVSYYPIFL